MRVGLFADVHTIAGSTGYDASWSDTVVHELSVCQALLIQVGDIARHQKATVVLRITIECGPLSGIEPTLLSDAFAVMRAGGVAATADLLIVPIGVSVECRECGVRSATPPNRLVCAACGGFRTQVIAGDELRLRNVELRLDGRCPGGAV